MCDNTAVLYPIIFSYLVIQYDYFLSEAFSNGTKNQNQNKHPPPPSFLLLLLSDIVYSGP